MTRLADPIMEKAVLSAAMALRPRRPPRLHDATLVVGFDSEYDPQPNIPESKRTHPLLALSFATRKKDGTMFSSVFDPPAPKLSPDAFLEVLLRFLADGDITPSTLEGKGCSKSRCSIALPSHFAIAEASGFESPFSQLRFSPVGAKANHITLPPLRRGNVDYHIRVVDTFAFFPCALEKLGRFVGLPKERIDIENIAKIKEVDRASFDRYSRIDAEIVFLVFETFRAQIRTDWGLDILSNRSLASVAAEIYRRHFHVHAECPARLVSAKPRKRRSHANA